MDPFWDLKFSEYVEYLACIQRIPYKQRIALSDEQPNPMDIILYRQPCTIYMYNVQQACTMSSVPPDQSSGTYRVLLSFAIKVESHSQIPDDLRLVCNWGAGIVLYSERTILRTFTTYIHHFHYAATEGMVKFSLE